ncbi:MAG: hypothetical protein AB8B74_01095 [Crocinitomicaceae bacterium]
MEILYYLTSMCLLVFMILATYDGLYLHIWKFGLFSKRESVFEHKTHTIRAILFPLIIWFLFIRIDDLSFWIGIGLVVIDLITLGIDAYSENDSRKALGGLPKWEYILHLFANGFHFAAILLMLATKIKITDFGFLLIQPSGESFGQQMVDFISVNIIPGAIALGLLHLLLLIPKVQEVWFKYRSKVVCC